MIETLEDGQTVLAENEKYWEATLKLLRSNVALAGDGQTEAKTESANYLKRLYIRWGEEVGGRKWGPEFEKLRQELIPDFDPDADPEATTAPMDDTPPAADSESAAP